MLALSSCLASDKSHTRHTHKDASDRATLLRSTLLTQPTSINANDSAYSSCYAVRISAGGSRLDCSSFLRVLYRRDNKKVQLQLKVSEVQDQEHAIFPITTAAAAAAVTTYVVNADQRRTICEGRLLLEAGNKRQMIGRYRVDRSLRAHCNKNFIIPSL